MPETLTQGVSVARKSMLTGAHRAADCGGGCGTMELTRRIGTSKASCWRWRKRFLAALLHGSADRSHRPPSRPNSGDTDGDRASQLQHAVQDMDGDTNLGGTTLVLMKAQTVPDHLFVASDGDLHPAASG
jgi:hypothetical protein